MQVLAAHVQGDFGLLPDFVHGEDDVGVDHMVEMARHALELRAHVAADGRGHFEMMAAHVQVHGHKAFLWLTAGIWSAPRYFAVVGRGAPAAISAYMRLIRSRGIASELRLARHTLRTLRTVTSGMT